MTTGCRSDGNYSNQPVPSELVTTNSGQAIINSSVNPCSHVTFTFVSPSTLKFNIVLIVTYKTLHMHHHGYSVQVVVNTDVLTNANVTCERP